MPSVVPPRADLGTARDMRIVAVETDRKYRARRCG
jgi:hypothetical protein